MASHLPTESSTLSPLPELLRDGLIAVTVFGFLSIVTTTLLITYITYRLVKWERVVRRPSSRRTEYSIEDYRNCARSDDLSLGLEERHYHQLKTKSKEPLSEPATPLKQDEFPTAAKLDVKWNPVLMLVYNLLYANLMEALAFLLSVAWLRHDGIIVPSAACWTQGWFMQVGKLVSSGMLVLISINSYSTIVRGYKPSRRVIYIATAAVWVIAITLPLSSVLTTKNGIDHGGFYARAGAWCWVNQAYGTEALWLEYFWIFLAMGLTVLLLGVTLFSMLWNNQSARHLPSQVSATASGMELREKDEPPKPSGQHPAFLAYQAIYILCTAPLAISRMAAMGGVKAGWTFYSISGSLIASHGTFLLHLSIFCVISPQNCTGRWWHYPNLQTYITTLGIMTFEKPDSTGFLLCVRQREGMEIWSWFEEANSLRSSIRRIVTALGGGLGGLPGLTQLMDFLNIIITAL
ncbi:uncharacterized protein JN550_010242 [Neoarthrinium moseri]|uniref:uncharacterized protein n=1 Tax=Neoarthrinium moseri TaxID=1658444 RepID=UPI001FDADBE1|nr:uncharacterized protein JN550_010242 [Neoarthrinium moseri]KAI1862380.1 hypothetical protein JN550_010242 [Neoarthrinium moseri]